MAPFSGFDRGVLEGISRYTQLHGPWIFFRPDEYPEVPWPTSESVAGSIEGREYLSAERIRAEVRRCFEAKAGEGGGCILCPSDHFFAAELELVEAFADEAHRGCCTE